MQNDIEKKETSFELIANSLFKNNDISSFDVAIEKSRAEHASDDFEFYKGILDAIKNNSLTNKIEYHNIKFFALDYCWDKMKNIAIDNYLLPKKYTTLISLQRENFYYQQLETRFKKKPEVTHPFMSKKEFVEEEIRRIKSVFIRPITTILSGDFKKKKEFNYTKYSQNAYNWLCSGENFQLNEILFNALTEYETYVDEKKTYNANSVFAPLVVHSIFHYLSEGVAYLMYEKFLKDQISKTIEQPILKKASKRKERKTPPAKTRALLQKEIKSSCPFCKSEDVDHFEIHHIDEIPSNNNLENLLMLCPTCHSKITKGDITKEQVIFKKTFLLGKSGSEPWFEMFSSKELFKKTLGQLISHNDSVYYEELREHWNSYSLIEDSPFLNELLDISLAKSIEYGLLPLISDLVTKHLYYDKNSKYLYNQQHIYMHNSEDEGFNYPVYYHISLIGILYTTAIRNKIDVDIVAPNYKNMQSIYSSMVKGMIDNMDLVGFGDVREYPTNYHWLIGEILSFANHWLNEFNEQDNFIETSSYVNFISFNIQLCFLEMYDGIKKNKVEVSFVVSQFYYKVLTSYFSPLLNNNLRQSVEKNIISGLPNELVEPILKFSLDNAYAVRIDEFYKGRFHVINSKEEEILNRFRKFLFANKKIEI